MERTKRKNHIRLACVEMADGQYLFLYSKSKYQGAYSKYIRKCSRFKK